MAKGKKVLIGVGICFGVILLAVAAWLVDMARKSEGKLWGFRVFSLECDYRIVFAVVAVAALCVLLAAIVPGIAYYLMWALGVLLFAELVYYTTKLM